MRKVLWLSLAVIAVACSGDDAAGSDAGGASGASGSGGGGGAASEYSCRQSCETNAECAGFPLSGCAGDIGCSGWPSSNWRPEVRAAYRTCEAGCPSNPQACPDAAFAAAGGERAIDRQYASACSVKDAECDLPNTACGAERLYVEATVMEALACLDNPCAMVSSCLDALFKE